MEENKVMENQATEVTTEVEITDLTPAEQQTVETGDSMIKGAIIGAAVVGIGIGAYKGVKFVGKKVKAAIAKRKADKEEIVDVEAESEDFVDVPEAEINPVEDTDEKG